MAGEALKVGSQTITGPILGTSSSPANITTATARPYSLADMDVDSALILESIQKKLQIEATLDDIFVDVGAEVVFTGKKVAVPDACVMKLKSQTKGEHSQVIPLLAPLAGPGRGGVGEAQQGYERGQVLRFMKAYYNEYSQAMAGEEWGVAYNEVQLFGLYSQIQPMLSKWGKEDLGKQYREALLETYSWPLTKAGADTHSAGLTQKVNPNFFVANTAPGSQPTWSSTEATYIGRISTAMQAADGGTNGSYANIDLNFLIALDDYAVNTKKITPVTIGGKSSYVVLLPSPQYKKLMQVNDGQLGGVWQHVSALTKEEQEFPGIVGRVLSLVIIEDQRYPTWEWTSYSDDEIDDDNADEILVEYVEPGNDDNRNKAVYSSTSNMAWDIGFLMGGPALIDWLVTDWHLETEKTEYGKKYGRGIFTERGVQLARYTNDTGNINVNYGSIVLAFTATTLMDVA